MRFLFVGLGSIGQRHLRNLRALLGNDCEIIAYRALRRDVVINDQMQVVRGSTIADFYGIREFTDYQEALAERPDAVFITNPSSLHLPFAIEAATAGCNLFIEKPLSVGTEGLEQLIDLVDSKGLVAFVGHQQRFHPGMSKVREWLADPRLGRPVSARFEYGEYLPYWHPYEDYRNTYGARADLGGGALLTLIHSIDCAVWLFGKPGRLFAAGGHLSHLALDVEDVSTILMAYVIDGGTLPVVVSLDYLQWPGKNSLVVVGDQGKIIWDFIANRGTLTSRITEDQDVWENMEYTRNEAFMAEMLHFLACLRGQEEPLVSLREASKSVEIAASARQSMNWGKVIEL